MLITELIKSDMVKIDYEFQDKDDVVNVLSSLLKENGVIESTEGFISAVKERESLTTTAVGFGIAIPHARSKYVLRPGIAIGRSKEFFWDDETKQPIRLIFLLAVPEQVEYPEYMKILASISRMLVHERFRNSLLKARDINEFISIVSDGKRYLVNGNNTKK